MVYSTDYRLIKAFTIVGSREMISYDREVTRWEDYLRRLVGFYDLYILIVIYISGNFIEYLTTFKWIAAFYTY